LLGSIMVKTFVVFSDGSGMCTGYFLSVIGEKAVIGYFLSADENSSRFTNGLSIGNRGIPYHRYISVAILTKNSLISSSSRE